MCLSAPATIDPCEIHHVETGQAALAYLHKLHSPEARPETRSDAWADPGPDVVLLDLRLPGIDGLETLKRIRLDERTKNLPVVILTTSKADEDKLESYEHHINGYVKPLGFDSFGVLLDVVYLVLTR